jgi:hypothetical protein
MNGSYNFVTMLSSAVPAAPGPAHRRQARARRQPRAGRDPRWSPCRKIEVKILTLLPMIGLGILLGQHGRRAVLMVASMVPASARRVHGDPET